MTHEAKLTFPGTAMPDSVWWKALWPHPERVLAELGIQPGTAIVDLCCGNGHFTIPLARLAEKGKVYGIDMDKVLLEEARTSATHAHVHIEWICGDAMSVEDLLPEKVDCIMMANTTDRTWNHGLPTGFRNWRSAGYRKARKSA